ncbi:MULTISPECIES: aminodeoxychorismate lyase [unclassified Curtobacterium]|uniref:aminodeoxychorismate lyase n=1 Tax=unclassified Curtobacterium TaxID=257496 RepID=UPI000F467D37|nr:MULTISPECIES: aminodeoxychorismate lyase [unclassified Curtobacterium]ROQ04080.1 4-amino-4-deoxychorismate lyase [Curtobacterium sp. PhB171]ROQ19345.1 4-amino-4-deoxychorismate lyase [Curtobacterium sp. PhB170]ROS32753.1 4-amino-4-deoxychorismate lyase [Curtobacterium sp. PhB131]ROS64316.1 4-amino-4-deoxychorismate lyase [Curtobacterium sp. PhB141]
MTETVLAILNQPSRDAAPHDTAADAFTWAKPLEEHLQVQDLGITRGDGVFETITVVDGRPQALEAHLDRFGRSAAMLDLPAPDPDAWRQAIEAVCARLDPVREAFAKTVLTRGVEGTDRPTGWVYAAPSVDSTAARTEGISVVVLDRGYRHDVERTSPWLLQGAKTLSYAVNMAALREAVRRGADDALFVSSDGYVLEGTRANLILKVDDRLVTPRTDIGILAGTTQADVFRFAEQQGIETAYELVTLADLQAADALWLVSSVRQAAPIRSVNGDARAIDADLTDRINEFLLAREV